MEFLSVSRRRSSSRNVPSDEEQGETDVFLYVPSDEEQGETDVFLNVPIGEERGETDVFAG